MRRKFVRAGGDDDRGLAGCGGAESVDVVVVVGELFFKSYLWPC